VIDGISGAVGGVVGAIGSVFGPGTITGVGGDSTPATPTTTSDPRFATTARILLRPTAARSSAITAAKLDFESPNTIPEPGRVLTDSSRLYAFQTA